MTIAGDFYGDITTHNGELKETNMERLPAPPEGASQGRLYYNTTSKHFYGFDGTSWILMETLPDPIIEAFETLGELVNAKTSESIPETLVFRDENGSFEGDFYTGVDFHNSEMKNVLCESLADHPQFPTKSRIYFNTTDNRFYGYDGAAWKDLSYDKTDVLNDFTTKQETNAVKADVITAQTTANSKKRIFTTTPYAPYDIGDLWSQGASGDLLRCKTRLVEGGTYSSSHWERAFKWDMARSIYDTNANGIVDNAEKVNGFAVRAYVPPDAIFTDTIYEHPTSHPPSIIAQDVSNRFVSDSQIASWDGKQDILTFAPEDSANKGMAGGYAELGEDGKVPLARLPDIPEGHTHDNKATLDKITGSIKPAYNLDIFITGDDLTDLGAGDMLKTTYDIDSNGIVDNAERVNGLTVETAVPLNAIFTDTVYEHPVTHPPTVISQDADNRFVSDSEKAMWNSKQDTIGFTPENSANKGQANGYPTLGADSKIPLAQLPDIGAGDMLASVYDKNNSGTVDNAEKVNGFTIEAAVPSGAVFTDTVYDDTDILMRSYDLEDLVVSPIPLDADLFNGRLPADYVLKTELGTVSPDVAEWAKAPTKPSYTKEEVGLGNVDNTSDFDKPISNATQNALVGLQGNDIEARREILDMKLQLDELEIVSYLNKTGIGFFDLFKNASNIDSLNTTALIEATDVIFSGAKTLQMKAELFSSFSDLELVLYDLEREHFLVDVTEGNNVAVSMAITPGSRTAGEQFWHKGEVYTITSVVEVA